MQHRLKTWLILPLLCVLASCQTPNSGVSTDTTALVIEAVSGVRAEMCNGQKPVPVDVTPEEFDTWPDPARSYVLANVRQYQAQCAP
jgi:hypothetical protein